MDGKRGPGTGRLGAGSTPPPPTFVLPSRAAALAAARDAVDARAGLLVVTGEAGVGKTWLGRRIEAASRPGRPWVRLDLAPGLEPVGLHAAIAHALGLLDDGEPEAGARWVVERWLAERAADGERWSLWLDEAHAAAPALLEEVRVLANRLGEPGGFAAIGLAGQTPLARRLEGRPLAPLRARVREAIHLRPLDVEEAGRLLAALGGRRRAAAEVEALHRETGGNPQALLRLAARLESAAMPATATADEPPAPAPVPGPTVRVDRPAMVAAPRPPILVAEGVVEVGWQPGPAEQAGEAAAEVPAEPAPVAEAAAGADPAESREETIQDHYAAIQAWDEWSHSAPADPGRGPAEGRPFDPGPESASGRPPGAMVWTEGQHAFAPYSQLFSRLKRARDVE